MIVVDDQLLLDVLAGTTSQAAERALGDHAIATTLSWYFRLARALNSDRTHGSLSRRFAAIGDERRADIQSSLSRLPEAIVLVDSRSLVPVMVAVCDTTRANLLTADAIATALILDAGIALSVATPLLDEAALTAHVSVTLVQ